ncbi:MAG TPA: hypothetical protein VJR89_36205 [Polyangiales bacterium]|nr:hypothetical protein [Polyangiales bacterium]
MPTWLVAAVLLAGCAAALLLIPRAALGSPTWTLLRVLFPSWRFFEDIAPGPTLHYSVAPPGQPFGPWHAAQPYISRSPFQLLLNARGNLWLAYQSLIDQLWNELDESSTVDPTRLVSYQLVQRLVLVELLSPTERASGTRYRFRLASEDAWLDEFVSPEQTIA